MIQLAHAVRRAASVLILLAFAALLSVAAAAAPLPALAQASAGASGQGTAQDAPSEQDLRALLDTLEDDAKRQEFIKTLKTALEVRADSSAEDADSAFLPDGLGHDLLETVAATLRAAGAQVAALTRLAEALPEAVSRLGAAFDTPQERKAAALGLGRILAALLAGAVGYLTTWRLLVRPRIALQARRRNRWGEHAVLVLGRLVLAVVPPLALVAVTWAALPLLQTTAGTTAVAIVLVAALASYKAAMAVAGVLFSPSDEEQRFLPMDGETAHYLTLWVRRFALVAVIGYFGIRGAGMLGLAGSAGGLLRTLAGLLLAVMGVIFVLQNRHAVAGWLRRGTHRPPPGQERRRTGQRLRERLADVWHVLAALYVIAAYVIWAAQVPGGFLYLLRGSALSALVVGVALVLGHLLERGLTQVFHISAEAQRGYPGLERRANRYVPLLGTVLRGILWTVAGLTLLQVWGLDTLVWLTLGGGQRLTRAAVTIGIVLLVSVILWEVVSAKIERYFSETDTDGNVIERSARARTLLPLLRNILLVVLVVVVALIVLSEIGVNIAPLLAGAGVIGLAIGFGSQKLVQDVITGAFILFEDTMAVGDVVQVGGHGGVVEGLTIRSLRLRDLSGNVHTIPFSSVDTMTNMTKDFSYYVFDVGVAYREDTDEVAAVLTELGQEMQDDPYYGALILEPLEILGVDKFADSAVMVKARVKTRPIRQWEVGREFNRRMKKAFDARNIEIPFPHTTLYFGVDKQGKAPPGRIMVDDLPRAPDATLAPPTPLPESEQTSGTPTADPDG